MADTIYSDDEDNHDMIENDVYKYASISEIYGAINKEIRSEFLSILQFPNFDDFVQLISPKTYKNKVIEPDDMDDIDIITELKNSMLQETGKTGKTGKTVSTHIV